MKAEINYDNKTIFLLIDREKIIFSLSDGDIGDYWKGFNLNGQEYDLNFYQEEGEKPFICAYPVVNGKTDTRNGIDVPIVKTEGEEKNYFTKTRIW